MNQRSMLLILTVLIGCVVATTATSVTAQAPTVFNYQGRLTSPGGEPMDTTVSIAFTITDIHGGPLWSELHYPVNVVGGLFKVSLGSLEPFPVGLFDGDQRLLQIQVGGDAPIYPPTVLNSVPFAAMAKQLAGGVTSEPGQLTVPNPDGGEAVRIGSEEKGRNFVEVLKADSPGGANLAVSISADNMAGRIDVYNDDLAAATTVYPTSMEMYLYGDLRLRMSTNVLEYLDGCGRGGNKTSFGVCGMIVEDTTSDTLMSVDEDGITLDGDGRAFGDVYYRRNGLQIANYEGVVNLSPALLQFSQAGCSGVDRAVNKVTFGGCGMTMEDTTSDTLASSTSDGTYYNAEGVKGSYDAYYARDGMKLSAGSELGYVLTCNSQGVGTWQPPSGGADADWCQTDNVLYTCDEQLGIARGGATLWGPHDSTHVNLGVDGTTGALGQNVKHATVLGGRGNSALDDFATAGGGFTNAAESFASTVAGGYENTVAHSYSGILGGKSNVITGYYSSILGGLSNEVGSNSSCITGGGYNYIKPGADYSMAFGNNVALIQSYRVAFFNSFNSGYLGINRDSSTGDINFPIHVGASVSNGNGARLTHGGVWTNGSSREFKDNFQPLDHNELLGKVAGLQIDAWQFRDSDERHIGPLAEEFVEAFDIGTIRETDGSRENQYLAAGDVAGVALASVQALLEKIEQLETRIAELEGQNK